MGARTKARKRALDILFESELRGTPLTETLAARVAAGEPPVSEYAVELVEGVGAHREELDRVLSEHAQGWTLARMPAVDRNILRLGAFEVLYNDDVPDEVAISEAVGLARDLSTDASPPYVNGVLAAIRDHRPRPAGGRSPGEADPAGPL